MPAPVRYDLGQAIYLAQLGGRDPHAETLTQFGPDVVEVKANHDGETFRAVYTVRFREVVYVLHAWQKQSRHGIKMNRQDIELIRVRLDWAHRDYEARKTSDDR